MSEGLVLTEMAGEVVAAELDDMLDRLLAIGEAEGPPERPKMLVDEYRLVVAFAAGSGALGDVQDVPLGAVNEAFAFRKAQEIRDRQHPAGVIVQRRKLLRGEWERVTGAPSQDLR